MPASLSKIQKICKPIFGLAYVKSVWVFGSWTTGRRTRKSDIDILILLDDTENIPKDFFDELDNLKDVLRKKAKNRGLNLHFQSPKMLTQWWDLVREGEPWTITSIRTAVPLYDPSNYLTLIKNLLKRGELFSLEDKSQKLLERATEKMDEIRDLLVNELTYEFLMAATDSAQAVLMYAGEYPPEPENVAAALKKAFVSRKMLSNNAVETYEELFDIRRKVVKGVLSEFTGTDLDRYMKRLDIFVTEIERLLGFLEKIVDRKGMDDKYSKCMRICKLALKKKLRKNIPRDDLKAIENFKKMFVDRGLVGENHYKALMELYKYHKSSRFRKPDYVNIRGLELTLKDMVKS